MEIKRQMYAKEAGLMENSLYQVRPYDRRASSETLPQSD
jgi:hypothetical protein